MAEPVLLSSLLFSALRLTTQRRVHFLFMGLWGIAGATAAWLARDIALIPPETATDLATFGRFLASESHTILVLTGISIGLVIAEALIRGPLILVLEDTLTRKSHERPGSTLPSFRFLLRAASVSLFISLLYIALLTLIGTILFTPVALAIVRDHGATSFLVFIALTLFFGLSVLFYFIKEFTLYYTVLSRIPLRSSAELGTALFQRHMATSLLFGLLLVGLSLIFTFTLDSAIITSAAIAKDSLFATLLPVFLFTGFYSIFEQLLRLLFFHALAAPKKKEREPRVVVSTKSTPESVV